MIRAFYYSTTLIFILLSIDSTAQILGFESASAVEQAKIEQDFDAQLKAQNLDDWMKIMAAKPHYVGSPHGKANAEWMLDQFKSWGYDAKIETYHVLFPYPKLRLLEMTAPTNFKASLAAKEVEGDKYTAQGDELLPSYNAFSRDGDVEAELVFVNYGVPADYEELERLGIDVKGKIVIAKYYGSWRGIKPKLAAEKGAIGCIIYSDPKDDGFYQGDVYPEGAYKNETGVQRGSVMDMPTYPGDVLTPGYGATKNAKRIDRKDAPTITKIPVLPISYADALPLLKSLEGPVVPASWKGALPLTYHIGPGPAKVHLKLEFDWQLKPAYNVIAKMKGSEYPDEWIIRGNHHDAWVHGANDPVSGMVALMEEARSIGMLAKNGNTPKRSIIYCAWDAEEPGLIGSTEWVEDHQEELKEKTIAYINTDSNGRGFLFAGGSHTLESMVSEILTDINDPQTDVTLAERRSAFNQVTGSEKDFSLYAVGSGSDYSPFIQHAGIASLNLGFGGESSGGEYHTIYDTYDHYKRFKDHDFAYGVALAKVAGRIVLRLANADVLPFEFKRWESTISTYISEVMDLTDKMRKETEKHNKMVANNVYKLASNPKDNLKAPEKNTPVPYLDFSELQNAMTQVSNSVSILAEKDMLGAEQSIKDEFNEKMKMAEHLLTSEEGLPRRPWYKHQIYAPGFYTGYGVKTLPAVREAIEQENWSEAQAEIKKLAATLTNFNNHLKSIITLAE